MADYFIHYSDGTVETRHWCDECDEREAVFFAAHEAKGWARFWEKSPHEQLCRPCFSIASA